MKYEYDNADKLNSIEVTLAMGCKLGCRYCPQSLLLKKYFSEDSKRSSMMDFEDFKRILSKVKNGGTICFSGMCEPFLNPRCDDMIVYAYEKGYRIVLLTTLVGFQKKSIEKIKKVVFDEITLHIPDEESNSKFDVSEEYLENVRLFHENFKVSNYSCHGNIHPLIKPYVDKNKVCISAVHNRAGNLEEGSAFESKGEIVCMIGTIGGYGNWTPEVLPDGTLLLCCMDYGMKHILGNLLKMDVKEIFAGAAYQKVQRGMKEDNIDILCRRCTGAKEVGQMPAYQFQDIKRKFMQGEKIEAKQEEILRLFAESKNICVFGLGKLFWDNFFSQKWNEVLGQTCFCDNSAEWGGKEITGIKCVSPQELTDMENLLVITHITDDSLVRQQLNKMGITDIVNIKEIYRML